MKKISIVAVLAIAAAGFTACGNQGPKANLKTDVDTMSYAIGMAQTQGLKEYLVGSLDVDTAYMAEFIKGLNEGANAGDRLLTVWLRVSTTRYSVMILQRLSHLRTSSLDSSVVLLVRRA